jgi:hypothetical protein
MRRALILLVLLSASCGDNAPDWMPVEADAPPSDLTGNWEYTWPTPQMTLHGTMTLNRQEGSNVFGYLGYPTDPGYQGNEATWRWDIWAQVSDSAVKIYADDSGTSEPWWFEVTVQGDRMSGPALAGYAMQDEGMFEAVRQP